VDLIELLADRKLLSCCDESIIGPNTPAKPMTASVVMLKSCGFFISAVAGEMDEAIC
jgi:hypothetical protein